MAFVSRAERDTSFPATKCTNDTVGPGSYSILPGRRVTPSAVPFASNTKRSSAETIQPSTPQYTSKAAKTSSTASQPVVQRAVNPHRCIKSSSFASSTSRFTASKDIAVKPGPGTYQTVPKWSSKQSAVSPKHRAEASKQHTALLGPAAGPCAAVVLSSVQAAGQPGSAGSSKFMDVPVSTPPSIPARHQSYGYEQGPGGLLLMQPPPPPPVPADKVQDAITASNCQPYRRSQDISNSAAKGTAWAASKTDRWQSDKRQQAQQQMPEPGSYNVECGATRFRLSSNGRLVPCHAGGRGSFSAAGTAAFLSKAARPHQQEPDPERMTPGPGAYIQQQTLRPQSAPQTAAAGFRPAHCSSKHQRELFSRLPGRDCAMGGLPGVTHPPSVVPGPGTYDISSNGSLSKEIRCSRATLPPGASAAARAVGAKVHQDQDSSGKACAASASGFGSTGSRFDDVSSSSPGPGKYTSDELASIAAEVARKAAAASKRGAFGSAAGRFTADCSGLDGPVAAVVAAAGAAGAARPSLGPGAYDVDWGVAKHVETAAARPSPGFVSSSQRFSPAAAPVASPDYTCWDGNPESLRGDVARLGPGAYLHLDAWGSKCSQPSSCAGPRICGRHLAYHNAPFGSEGQRSNPTLATTGASSTTPGPGAYSPPVGLNEVFRPLSVPGTNNAGFCTGSRRFLSSSTASPGPGAYTADLSTSCSLVRPSFNVTLD